MVFSTALKNSYKVHPAFNTSECANLNEVEEDFKTFNQNYKLLSAWPRPASEDQLDFAQRAKAALSKIIDNLSNQALEQHEKHFLNELKIEILRNLESDIQLFKKQNKLDIWTRYIFRKHKPILSQLNNKKYYTNCLPLKIVEKILFYGKAHLEKFRENVRQGKLTREDLSFNSGPEAWEIKKLLHQEFDNIGVIDAVSEYMKQPYEAAGQAFELSVSKAQWWRNGFHGLARTPDTLYAHLDESIGVPKAIVYLTDVTLENGPTGYYENLYEELELNPLQEMIGRVLANIGSAQDSPLYSFYNKAYHQSMTSEKFRHHFMRLPDEIRFNSHFGWDVMPDTDAETIMRNQEQKLTGPAGTFVVFDGARLLHRGGLVNHGERIALQVVFNPTKQEKLRKRIFRQYFS